MSFSQLSLTYVLSWYSGTGGWLGRFDGTITKSSVSSGLELLARLKVCGEHGDGGVRETGFAIIALRWARGVIFGDVDGPIGIGFGVDATGKS